ncbi:hypothetical protein FRC04_002281 [Tulasnella sp. 424]|nr:hypothetical protein FRC04_002281 [Tulasnella sp. 424]
MTRYLLYRAVNLAQNEEHTVIVNPARLLESIIVEMDLGDEADMIMSMNDGQLFEQDGFVATGQWNTNAAYPGDGRTAGTYHVSEGSGSEISYTFEGDAITLWGAVEDQYSLYQVSVDGAKPISYSPSNTTSSSVTILAHNSNLGLGSRTITYQEPTRAAS